MKPVHYDLTLTPDFEVFTFDGDVDIGVHIAPGTTEIVLNSLDLHIDSAVLVWTDAGREHRQQARAINYDTQSQTAIIEIAEVPEGLERTQHLRLAFHGKLNDKLRGFYRSRYTNPEGETAWLACTQFEPCDARRALPCFDEPAMKATFKVTLNVPEGMVAVSNMPISEEVVLGTGLKTVAFATSPAMSTYLLAFVIGDLACIEKPTASGSLVRVCTTRGKEQQGQFALDTSVKLLSFYNDYFGIKYPLPKLDHVALPDFAAGAMENWGCITYRETALLLDDENSSAETRKRIAVVVAHELAHLWFGDLATMTWWDALWLNESFATYMATKALDWLFPEWQMWVDFVNSESHRAFHLDGLMNSHPVHQEVREVTEVGQLFDAISYSKGGSVLRMLEGYVSGEAFRKGLHLYLTRFAYRNASTTDLWQALEDASEAPVKDLMSRWTGQTGYPVLDVRLVTADSGPLVKVRQRRFLYEDILDGAVNQEESIWPVPLSIRTAGASVPTVTLLETPSATVPLPNAAANSAWMKVNVDQTGFYRVNYGDADWQRLVPAIADRTLPPADRLGVQSDAYALSRAGLVSITRFLTLADAYENEKDASVWSNLAANLREIEGIIAHEPCLEAFQARARRLFAAAAHRSGWEPRAGEGHLDALLRSVVLREAGGYGDPEVIAQAHVLFDAHLAGATDLHPDLRGLVYGLEAQEGSRETYNHLWALEKATELHEEKTRLLMSLGRFRHEGLLQETLERSLGEEVRVQDTVLVVSAVAANLAGRALAWDFVKTHWREFDRRYGDGGFDMIRLVAIVEGFSSRDKREDVATFFEANPVPSAERAIRQALERIDLNAAWLARNREALAELP